MKVRFWRVLFLCIAIMFIVSVPLVKEIDGIIDNNDIAFMIYGLGLMIICKTCHDWKM